MAQSKLFIGNADLLLEEDPLVTPVSVDCMSYVREKLQENVTLFYHPSFGDPSIKQWPRETTLCCLHCCDQFSTVPVPNVRRYDELRNIYYVYGIYCSVNCAKTALMESEPSLSTTRLLYFSHMCRTVFGIHEAIVPAPPRIRLQKFGGDLSTEQFRQHARQITSMVLEPPFIQSALLCQDHRGPVINDSDNAILTGNSGSFSAASSYTGGVYAQFLNDKRTAPETAPEPAKKKRKQKSESEDKNGGLAAFLTFQQ